MSRNPVKDSAPLACTSLPGDVVTGYLALAAVVDPRVEEFGVWYWLREVGARQRKSGVGRTKILRARRRSGSIDTGEAEAYTRDKSR